MVEIDVAYQGDLHCEAIHGPSGTRLTTDAPKDNMGRGESFSPTDLVATALGSCMLTIVGIVGRRHHINLEGATAHVTKEMAAAPVRRIARLGVTIRIPGVVSEEDRRRIEQAVYTCPVHKSLHPDVAIPVVFEWE